MPDDALRTPEQSPEQLSVVILRVPRLMLDKIDAFGCDRYLHRSEKIRQLMSVGLEVAGGGSHG